MGRGILRVHLLSSPLRPTVNRECTMRTLLVNMVLLAIAGVTQVLARCDADPVSNKIIKKLFKPYTVTNANGKPKADSPCWWDLTKTNCGTCKNNGNYFSCFFNAWCGQGASCVKKTGSCSCEQPYIGNGFQCFSGDCESGNCTLVEDPSNNVKVDIDTQSEFFVYTLGSGSTEL